MSDSYGGYLDGPPELDPDAEPVAYALERAILSAVLQFQRAPDSILRPGDLTAAVVGYAQSEPSLIRLLQTRDQRRTPLLHCEMPSFRASQQGSPEDYALALLHPNWVRGRKLAEAGNLNGAGARAWLSIPKNSRPQPLLAVATLRLVDDLASGSAMSSLLTDLNRLALARPEAVHRYMAVFCRHWDLNGQIRKTMDVFLQWANRHPQVSVVVVQSYHDDIGPVLGGRYINQWQHMAPFDPL